MTAVSDEMIFSELNSPGPAGVKSAQFYLAHLRYLGYIQFFSEDSYRLPVFKVQLFKVLI